MKFVLLTEGKTERESAASFLKRWLDPRLKQPVGIRPVAFDGYSELARKMATKARMYLESPNQSEIVAVIGLLDLYGPTFYPSHARTSTERYEWGVDHFEKTVSNERFRMFFAVHEFEAWLLSQPDIFPREVTSCLAGKIASPESVNFDQPPAKLLNRIYQQQVKRDYKKTTYGKQLFTKLDPAIAVTKCPYLKVMLQEMLALARKAGL